MGKVTISRGNMYSWVTHTWSPIIGCPHQCLYCYVRKFRDLPAAVQLEEPFPALGKDRMIFVAHMGDLFAEGVSGETIGKVLSHCSRFKNKYVFQTKNPRRMWAFRNSLPKGSTVGTTIETDDKELLDHLSHAPSPAVRANFIGNFTDERWRTFVTIEPIMRFDLVRMMALLETARPTFVNIGADSKSHGLPEPSGEQVDELVAAIDCLMNTSVKIKNNLGRLRCTAPDFLAKNKTIV